MHNNYDILITFASHLKQINTRFLSAFRHSDYDYETHTAQNYPFLWLQRLQSILQVQTIFQIKLPNKTLSYVRKYK